MHANVEFTVATDTAAVASAAARTVLNKYAFELQILLLKIKFFFRLSSRSLALSPSRARLKNTLQNDVKWHICEPCEFEFENVIKVVFFFMPTGYDLNIHKMNIQIIADRHHHHFHHFYVIIWDRKFLRTKKTTVTETKRRKKTKNWMAARRNAENKI